MEGITELREMWRQKRVQKLVARIQGKQKDQSKLLSDKVLGIKVGNKKMNSTQSDQKLSVLSLKPNTTKQCDNNSKQPRFVNKPKIIPRETKLSMQRKSLFDPCYKIQKSLENNSTFSFANHKVPRKNKRDKFPTPKITYHSCINLLDGYPRNVEPPTFTPLVKGLDLWLKKRGKHFGCFKNLKTITKKTSSLLVVNSDDKENSTPSSHTPTSISTSETLDENGEVLPLQTIGSPDMKRIVGALQDLSAIIRLGYPVKDCEEWLSAMRRYYPDSTKYPSYWECKAAINSRMGIRQEQPRAEEVTTQVNNLVSKLKVLNLNSPKNENTTEETIYKRRVLLDINVNNVVNSASIQFSVKKKDKTADNFIVTPVRRSARRKTCMHHIGYKDVKCVKSLLDLSEEVRANMEFEPNKALLNN